MNTKKREEGAEQPGVRVGLFTLRVPFYHFGIEWPEFIQGLIVAGATGLALIPILQGYFHVSFEMGLAVVVVQAVLIGTAPLIYGDPYCHGWITPAIPLILAFMAKQGGGPDADPETTREVIRWIIALTILNAALFLVFGLTGLGKMIVERIPVAVKGGIIFGAAVEAFHHELAPSGYMLRKAPLSAVTAVLICLVLMFSFPVARLRAKYRPIAVLAGLGLAPGFVTAMLVGWLTGEIAFDAQPGIYRPPFAEMFDTLSPFGSAGWPEPRMFLETLPLALVIYIIGFGDIITANAILDEASKHRPDEKLDINPTRTHLNVGIRNAIQVALAGPFPVVHGPLWTGVHVVVTERYKQGRQAMDSLYGGIGAYYFWGLPVLIFVKPITTFLQPMLEVALAMTIVLTGFACGYTALAMPRHNVERGVVVAIGMVLVTFGAWQGLLAGIVLTIILLGGSEELLKEKTAENSE